MRRNNLDILLIVIIALLNIVWSLVPNHIIAIGIILALPLVFLLPGYVLTEFFFHKRSINKSTRFTSYLGLSLSVDILSGFILNTLPIGLQAISWAAILGLITIIFSLMIAHLRQKTSKSLSSSPKLHIRLHELFLIVTSIIIIIFVIQYSDISARQHSQLGFTELWMLPPTNNCAIQLGIQSFETTSVKYRIVMTENGTQVNIWQPVILAPQQEWDRLVVVFPNSTNAVNVEVKLYKLDKPETVYRDVHLTLNNTRDSRNQKTNC